MSRSTAIWVLTTWIWGNVTKPPRGIRAALRLEPTNPVAYEDLGQIYLALNRFEDARTTTEEALGRRLEDITLHLNLYALAFSPRAARQT